ncbi:MAG: gliding motility-associated C-terminal domain-containing protein, partial [Bacteroidia bacterium]
GNTLLQSTYIGTSGYDQSYFVQLDKLNNVYIFGQTSGGYPITAGVYSNPNSGQFIHEFNSTLSSTIFSTEFGTGQGAPDIAPSAFLVDNCSNIYISGWGGTLGGYNITSSSTNGLPITSNAFQSTTDGEDFYFMVLQPSASALWYATYFGGDVGSEEHVDGGTSRFDKSGVIYQAICEGCAVDPRTGYTPNSDMPTTANAWSTNNQSNNCNNALVKFSFNLLQTVAALSINPSSAMGCAPFNVSFTNHSQNASAYSWHFGDGDTSTNVSPVHTYTAQGTYTVSLTAKDTLTCNVLDSIVAIIVVNPPPIITVNNPTICVGNGTTLTASGASTYTWSTGGTTAHISEHPTINTSYTVTATSANSCTNAAVANVTVNPLPIITVNSATICTGYSATLTATGATTYTWNTAANTSTITASPQVTTNYNVTGTDANLCVNTATASILVNQSPVLTITNPPICIGNTGTITASGASTYSWNTGATTTSITATPTITTHYTVTGTNTNGCITTKTITLVVNSLPVVSVNSATLCEGSTVVLTASGASTYVWNNNLTTALVALSPTVTTSYTVTGTDINHCKDTATAIITVFASPTVTVSSPSVCIGNTTTITATSTSPNFIWSTNETTPSIAVSPTVITTYTVSSTNGICTISKISTVTVLVNHTRILGGGHIGMCIGDSLKLQTTIPYTTYNWNTGQMSPTIEVTQAGTYTVQTIDVNGCKGTDSTKVYTDSKVAIPLKDTTICNGVNVQLQVTKGLYIYLWSPANSLNKDSIYNPIAHPTSTTTYTVWVTNGGCINTNTVTVFVNPLPTISVKPAYSFVMAGEAVNLQAQAIDSCYWSPTDWLNCDACNTNISFPYQDVTYTITTTNSFGCSASTKAIIKIDLESTFYIPNTFSPNGDEKNEIFKPAYTNIHNFKIDVFDRWGLQLFQSTNPDNGWDGTYKNGRCQEDVYVYKAEYYDNETNTRHTASGTVTLIR